MAKEQKLAAIDITRNTTVGLQTGGSMDVAAGTVLLVPNEIGGDDARYLCAMKKAKPCDPKLKAERAKQGAQGK